MQVSSASLPLPELAFQFEQHSAHRMKLGNQSPATTDPLPQPQTGDRKEDAQLWLPLPLFKLPFMVLVKIGVVIDSGPADLNRVQIGMLPHASSQAAEHGAFGASYTTVLAVVAPWTSRVKRYAIKLGAGLSKSQTRSPAAESLNLSGFNHRLHVCVVHVL
jgi:hypothetical protein